MIQEALFGDPATVDDEADLPRVVTQDPEWVATVVRHAQDPGYRVVEKSGRVFRVDPGGRGDVVDIATHEAETVQQLVEAGLLELGGNHTATYQGRSGPSRSVLVPRRTRDQVSRWSALKPLPKQRDSHAHAGTTRSSRSGRSGRSLSGTIHVDVVERGKALVVIGTTGTGGTIIRNRDNGTQFGRGAYLVENDAEKVIGSAASFRAGAEKLARHYGYQPGPVEIEHEHRHRKN